MKLFAAFCVLAVVCSALGAPDVENYDLVERSFRNIDLMSITRQLIGQLVEKLHKAAQEALESVKAFRDGILSEAKALRDKIIGDVQKFRQRVTDAIENVLDRFSNTGVSVRECVDSHRDAAAAVFNATLANTLACVDDRIAEISKEITNLVIIANEAKAAGSLALEDMKKCTGENINLLDAATCLGSVAFHTEMKSLGFLTESTMSAGRINLSIAALPATLEVCAGTQLIQTGIQTGKIIVEVGGCSANGVFNTIIGKPQVEN